MPSESAFHEYLVPLLGIPAFVGFWLVNWLIAQFSSWGAMARRFRTHSAPRGRLFRMESARIGWANYDGVLTVGVSEEGLYLAVFLPFRAGHPPLLIPWDDIHDPQARKAFFFWEYVEFSVGSPALARVRLRKRIFDAVRELQQSGAGPDELQECHQRDTGDGET